MNTALAILLTLVAAAAAFAVGYLLAAARGRADLAQETGRRAELQAQLSELHTGRDTEHTLATSLAPLSSSLARIEKQAAAAEKHSAASLGQLGEQLRVMGQATHRLSDVTSSLSTALKSSSARGAWGEVQLQRLFEHAGLLNRVDFEAQATGTTPDGTSVRPDAVVHLPGNKHIVVDAKAPMAEFLKATDMAEDDSERRTLAHRAHAKALRHHVKALASKDYWSAFSPSPEVVICFVPTEAMLSVACEADAALLDEALGNKVVLATPATLMAVLRSVALVWQHETLSKNSEEVFAAGRELHRRMVTLSTRLSDVGTSLTKSVKSYNALVGSAEARVFPAARTLGTLGVTDTVIPEVNLVDDTPRALNDAQWEAIE